MLDKIHIYVCIIAAVVITVVSILGRLSLRDMAVRLIIAIIAFYVIGLIVRAYLKKNVFVEKADSAPDAEDKTAELGGQ
ncbi:MAG: hypothetical protein LBS62_11170 [Clostridiales bacterium]|nr:hypothetical protein [Clostridiales bacterium]